VCAAERIEKTVEIEKNYMEIEEKGVKLRLTVVDTPGFNDAVDARHWFVQRRRCQCSLSCKLITTCNHVTHLSPACRRYDKCETIMRNR